MRLRAALSAAFAFDSNGAGPGVWLGVCPAYTSGVGVSKVVLGCS